MISRSLTPLPGVARCGRTSISGPRSASAAARRESASGRCRPRVGDGTVGHAGWAERRQLVQQRHRMAVLRRRRRCDAVFAGESDHCRQRPRSSRGLALVGAELRSTAREPDAGQSRDRRWRDVHDGRPESCCAGSTSSIRSRGPLAAASPRAGGNAHRSRDVGGATSGVPERPPTAYAAGRSLSTARAAPRRGKAVTALGVRWEARWEGPGASECARRSPDGR
jgi:hypothetical protein